ncbi:MULTISPECIES: GNAT family N-acetyltransferase [Acinetobacter]|jgi:putative hemolysin|uniref:GNAT family N-acetyltransferase n=1 Tax=Acinetobacter TaxID=469 RepID=UPI000C3CE599|nr:MULTISPECIES: GNAT family N-acetyltransferase [Acinetobacter]MBC69359.1 GNAT family N-acetyltransferase [Acinetobacter sp.]MBT50475.1 GNAT family N-acetyltransferase [Acinetobacter sp.]HIQ36300.1 GNAT family N-acetyltransferase [Acinetobacter venetianus]HJP48889.1 GNAT family N-acyltransferase [Acinetobacter venetianus]
MLEKLNQYRQTLTLPLRHKPAQNQFRFEWVDNLKELQEVQRFRATQFAHQFGMSFEDGLDQDLYDFGCEHAVLREKWTGEIVAYTRLKLFQGHEISQSYSAKEFEIVPQLSHLPNVLEIGRTCVHPRFRSGKALSMLWLNLAPKVLWSMRAKYLMGCVSIHLEDNLARTYYTHRQIQQLADHQTIDIRSKHAFEPVRPDFSFPQDERMPKLFQTYLGMQSKLSKEAFYDEYFKCLDYFVFLEVNKIATSFVMNKMVQR